MNFNECKKVYNLLHFISIYLKTYLKSCFSNPRKGLHLKQSNHSIHKSLIRRPKRLFEFRFD